MSIIQELLLKMGVDPEHFNGNVGEISDGYHTLDGLYFQRCVLFATICNAFKDLAWKSHRHHDGEECFGGEWFIVGIDTPKGSYTYHYENKYWDMFQCKELEVAKEWDGHTEKDVERLLYLTKVHGEEAKTPTWAEREVEIACKKENPNRKDGEFDYGCACYESALKAYNSLAEDGHSGFSINLTKRILNRLIDRKPLTPIEDTDDIWIDVTSDSVSRNKKTTFQCKRMSSLFKDVYSDGKVTYSDNNRYYCVDINNPSVAYHTGLVSRIIDAMFPITMPYMPKERPIKVYCEEFLCDEKNGDFDTVGVLYAIDHNDEKIEINRYFKEFGDDWRECDKEEYLKRKENKI